MIKSDSSKACCIPDRHNRLPSAAGKQLSVSASDSLDRKARETVCLGGSWFEMGCAESPHPQDGEGPVRSVWIDKFALATTAVSNREFQRFVDATHYKTVAERVGSSFVFHLLLEDPRATTASALAPWWREVISACWKSPEGPGSSLDDRWDHPVVHITRDDALQYCRWSGARLATEAEWEFAARGGLISQPYPWGDELVPDGRHRCNSWQGNFPNSNALSDGYLGTAPVNEYASNAYGLFNMTGNVWEWVADKFTHMHSPRETKNPKGPLNGNQFVAKGGSYLCHESYCLRYRTSSRQALQASVSTGNLGFRVAVSVS